MSLKRTSVDQAVDADVQIKVGSGTYHGMNLLGAAAGNIKVYDSASVAAVSNAKLIDVGGVTAANACAHTSTDAGVRFVDGLTVVVTGAGNLATIWHK